MKKIHLHQRVSASAHLARKENGNSPLHEHGCESFPVRDHTRAMEADNGIGELRAEKDQQYDHRAESKRKDDREQRQRPRNRHLAGKGIECWHGSGTEEARENGGYESRSR
jgi:hypothetical protein